VLGDKPAILTAIVRRGMTTSVMINSIQCNHGLATGLVQAIRGDCGRASGAGIHGGTTRKGDLSGNYRISRTFPSRTADLRRVATALLNSTSISEGDGARTRNHRIDSPGMA
jgi:hypothetical protein